MKFYTWQAYKLFREGLTGTLLGKGRGDDPRVGDTYRSDSGQVYTVVRVVEGPNGKKILTQRNGGGTMNFAYDQFMQYQQEGRLVRVY